ncbi:unnamed protein product [Orchesella dallaii]|uniref:Phospholipase A2-like domain-containing protein n=1 Tax=Orchesella dallaii TaxID=48710 RepID=A0ABP1RMK0_9HEXA
MATSVHIPEYELEEWRDEILRGTLSESRQKQFFSQLDSRPIQETAIDIDESEYSPLLTSSDATGLSIGSSSSVISSLSASAGVIGVGAEAAATTALYAPPIVIGAVAVGVAVKGVIDYKQAHYPGHNYLGPGTKLESAGEPVDSDDKIAKAHDIAYSKAKTREDIVAADNKAVHSFHSDFISHGNIHSAIGEVGIQAKQAVEYYLGPIYPHIEGTASFADGYLATVSTTQSWPLIERGKESAQHHRRRHRKKARELKNNNK